MSERKGFLGRKKKSGVDHDESIAGPFIAREEISYDTADILGKGNFGVVYKGLCRGQLVAVKVPKRSLSAKKVAEFKQEIEVMARIVSPRVVSLLGAYFPKDLSKGNVLVVVELFGNDIEKLIFDEKVRLSLYQRMLWAKQASEGMAWIHGAGCVHRDLKPSNILYDPKKNLVKVCDFGLSIMLSPGKAVDENPKGTPLYVAPELVSDGPTTHLCDVYSYGITLWAMLARMRPYDNWPELPDDLSEFLGYVVDGVRPWEDKPGSKHPFPSVYECPPSLKRLMVDCWNGSYKKRPSFETITARWDFILVDCAIVSSRAGRKFWKKYFVTPLGLRTEVPWEDFRKMFWKEFAVKKGEQEDRTWFNCIKELFSSPTPDGPEVSLQQFGRVLGFLPELKRGADWFRNIADLCRQPWFHGDTNGEKAIKALLPAPKGSFLVRFSSQPPNYAISFRDKHRNVHHTRLLREWGGEKIRLEKGGQMHPLGNKEFQSMPHLISALAPIMKWKALSGGPYWWIFHEKSVADETDGYRYLFTPDQGESSSEEESGEAEGNSSSIDSELSDEEQAGEASMPKQAPLLTADDIKPGTKIVFLKRDGSIVRVGGDLVQVLFNDNGRKEWITLESLLGKGMLLK